MTHEQRLGLRGTVIGMTLLMGSWGWSADTVKRDEHVVFFPTAAHLTADGAAWVLPIHGWILEPEADSPLRTLAVAQLRAALGLAADSASSEIFGQRAAWFLADNERGKELAVRLGDRTHTLEASEPDGHFVTTIQLDAATGRKWSAGGRLRFQAVLPADDHRRLTGEVHLVEPDGLSVVSDIDDTIKVTEVTDKKKLLENTFLRPFRAVDGMAAAYQAWAQDGAAFHFVSASPWQLYAPLSEFITAAGFPPATFHLRRVRLKDSSVLSLLANPLEVKLTTIGGLIDSYPRRRFVLVGDSGERDPEVYGQLARKYPTQIERIFIRDVTNEPDTAPRYARAFDDVPADKWRIFRDPAVLSEGR